MPLPGDGGTSNQRSVWPKGWPNIKLTWCSTTLGHEMYLPGGTSELRSTGPNLIPLLTMRCLYWGYMWLKCKKDIWKFEHTWGFGSCFTEDFSMKDQWKKNKINSMTFVLGTLKYFLLILKILTHLLGHYGHQTENSSQMLQRPYSFPLQHTAWVQRSWKH